MINTFPRMSHIVEYMELTGEHRLLIVADLHLGTPSDRHLRHRAALARAEATRHRRLTGVLAGPASVRKQPCDERALLLTLGEFLGQTAA